MKYCPICYKQYKKNENDGFCECGYKEYKEDLDDDDYKIYKFAKSIFLNKREWNDSKYDFINSCSTNSCSTNSCWITIIDIFENKYSIAKLTDVSLSPTYIDIGVIALNYKVKSLIINPDALHYDFLDETIVSSLFIGDKLKTIDHDMIRMNGCLRFIEVSENNNYFCAEDHVLYSKDKKVLYKLAPFKKQEEYYAPNTLKRICRYGLWSQYLKVIHLPKNVIIDKYAFNSDMSVKVIYDIE